MAKAKKRQDALRVRMYRVGFGDFFLVTVPTDDGPKHILIDCGATPGKTKKGDIGTIKAAVAHMAEETDRKLALIIATYGRLRLAGRRRDRSDVGKRHGRQSGGSRSGRR